MNSLLKAIDLLLRSLTGTTPVKVRVRVGANLKPVVTTARKEGVER
jgi:hypothetical protein